MEENKNLMRQQCPYPDDDTVISVLQTIAEDLIELIDVLNEDVEPGCNFCPLIEDIKEEMLDIPNGFLFRLFVAIGCVQRSFIDDSDPDCPPDYTFAGQLDRFQCVLRNLRTRLESIVCPDNERCEELIGELICALVQIILQLISLTLKMAVLLRYRCYCEPVGSTVFNCIVCEFVDEICFLEKLLKELNPIVIGLAECITIENCTPCYVAREASRSLDNNDNCDCEES